MSPRVLEKVRLSLSRRVILWQLTGNTILTDTHFMDFWWLLRQEGRTLLSIREAYNIKCHLSRAVRLGGAVAELGVFRGGGSKLICTYKSDAILYLFDTFGGMPAVNATIDHHKAGDFSDTSLASVQDYLKDYSDCIFHAGFFPETTAQLPADLEFCFVHLDVDIYESTLSGLEYFYPRLRKGGVIISHDYNRTSCPGVKKAFDEFFSDTPDDVIALWDTQCVVRRPT